MDASKARPECVPRVCSPIVCRWYVPQVRAPRACPACVPRMKANFAPSPVLPPPALHNPHMLLRAGGLVREQLGGSSHPAQPVARVVVRDTFGAGIGAAQQDGGPGHSLASKSQRCFGAVRAFGVATARLERSPRVTAASRSIPVAAVV